MNKYVIIGVYFGVFPEWFPLWELSAVNNPNIDFYIFTDSKIESHKNVKYVNFSMSKFNLLATNKLGFNVNLSSAYKLCDYKVLYGKIFEDYISGYDYWAHTDFDMFYGDLSYFLSKYDCASYDRFLPLGHLAFYKNTPAVVNRYTEYNYNPNYIQILQSPQGFAFDEVGMVNLYEDKGYSFFKGRIFAEINQRFKRFKLNKDDVNYKYQIFYYENGKVYRSFYLNGEIRQDEFMYVHFQSRKLKVHGEVGSRFYITSSGIYNKKFQEVTLRDIKKYNNYRGWLYEVLELKTFKLRAKLKRGQKKISLLLRNNKRR